jgi:hypothetical protein
MLRRAAIVLGILAVLSIGTTARAQPGRTPPGGPVPPPATYVPPPTYAPPPTQMRTDRYGMAIAGVDALAAGLVLLGTIVLVGSIVDGGDSGGDGDSAGLGVAMMIGGVGVYAFGPAFVHTRHKNNSGAWKSVGLRLGLPMLGGLLGAAMDSGETCDANGYCYDDDGDDVGGSLAGLGMLAAMIIDWGVLAKVRVPVAQPQYYPYAAPMAGGGGGTIGLAGAF